jgi:hypothetical protein
MIVRPAKFPDDVAQLCRMGKEFYQTIPMSQFCEFKDDSLQRFFSNIPVNIGVFVAENEFGDVCGTSGAMVFPLFFNDSIFMSQELFWWVDHKYRKFNAGKELHKSIEKWSCAMGAKFLTMGSIANDQMDRIDRLYVRSGYIPTEHFFIKGL